MPDAVDDRTLSESHHAEVAAQTAAVDAYYENEDRLTCHWDRISANELPRLLGWELGTVLDLGCGTGSAGAGLKHAGATVVGADLSMPCLTVAQRRLDAVIRADAARLPFRDGAFDAIVSRGALHHMAEPHRVLSEAHRVLRPGGRAVFMDPREYRWLEPIKHALRRDDEAFTHDHHAFGPEDYRSLVGQHFEVERLYTCHPVGILIAHGLDLLPLPRALPRRLMAEALLALDDRLNATPLGRLGHLLVVVGRRR